ncbi:hypothetical protein F5884DRAFT_865705 [Xylogone sp. PMI_703]|nr:hypothetical protein F5884DRAFT_865705 [Xylogone sp. PMI_703]
MDVPLCTFDITNGDAFVPGIAGISFSQTEPSQGHYSGSSWDATSDQYLQQDSTLQSHKPNGFENFTPLALAQMARPGRNPRRESNIFTDSPATPSESVSMSRFNSQDSIGAMSQRSTNYYDHTRSNMYPNISQMSFRMTSASSDITGRSHSPASSAFYPATQTMEYQAMDNYSYQNGDELSGDFTLYADSAISMSNATADGLLTEEQSYSLYQTSPEDITFTTSLENGHGSLADPNAIMRDSVIYNPQANDAPITWDSQTFMESRKSSPALEDWSMVPQLTQATNSPIDYSPVLEGKSPRYAQELPEILDLHSYDADSSKSSRKSMGARHSKVTGDIDIHEEPVQVIRRTSGEIDNSARDHPLYHNAAAGPDGLYHCPWEGDASCQHRPEKLKCNYEYGILPSSATSCLAKLTIWCNSKYVDSHLKPYRCKMATCENLSFSSTACLLRHEREAHAMHGHGDKPYLCTYEGCERGQPGNGFPRHWNLRDHMKRVHNDPGTSSRSDPESKSLSPGGIHKGSRKRKTETGDARIHKAGQVKKVQAPRQVSPRVQPRPASSPESNLIDRYRQTEQRLLETVKQLHDPKNASNMQFLRDATECIKLMAQTTQRIHGSSSPRRFSDHSG